jgi:hypothetical protein
MSSCPNCGDEAMARDDDSAFHAAVYRLATTMRQRGIKAEVPPPLCERCLMRWRDRIEDELREDIVRDRQLWCLHLGGSMTERQLLDSVSQRTMFTELLKKRAEKRQLAAQHQPQRTRRTDSGAGFGGDE